MRLTVSAYLIFIFSSYFYWIVRALFIVYNNPNLADIVLFPHETDSTSICFLRICYSDGIRRWDLSLNQWVYTIVGRRENCQLPLHTRSKQAVKGEMAPKLYMTSASPACRSVLMTANYLGLKLDVQVVNILKGEQLTAEYRKVGVVYYL